MCGNRGDAMLHSEIVPEHSCHGELVELNQAPTYLHLARCSSCGTEFTFEPDSDWVTIVLPGMKRKLVFAKSGSFTGMAVQSLRVGEPSVAIFRHRHRSARRSDRSV
jgi:hypothetical protein